MKWAREEEGLKQIENCECHAGTLFSLRDSAIPQLDGLMLLVVSMVRFFVACLTYGICLTAGILLGLPILLDSSSDFRESRGASTSVGRKSRHEIGAHMI
jgi:hypothetical protein